MDNILKDLYLRSKSEQILWLQQNRQILGSMQCLYCHTEMALKQTRDHIDGYEWRCINSQCNKYETSRSVRVLSWMEIYRSSSFDLYRVLYYYSQYLKLKDIVRMSSLGETTVGKIKKHMISKMRSYFLKKPIILGGLGAVIQCDETKLNHNVKSHRGRAPQEQVWAIFIVDTSYTPSRGYVEILPDRKQDTMLSVIQRVVRRGSTIITDEFRSSINVGKDGDYAHSTVCHKYNFVDPETGIHTQNVESYNNKIKPRIKDIKGVQRGVRADFLIEFMWFEMFKDNTFDELINLLMIN